MRAVAHVMESESAVDRLVLRDGSIAAVRPATGADSEAVRQFTLRLSPDARPRRQSLVLAIREHGEAVVAMCWYVAINGSTAEVRWCADEGLPSAVVSAMVARLAELASANGFQWIQTTPAPDGSPLLDALRDARLEVHSRSNDGVITVRLPRPASAFANRRADADAALTALFEPRAIAVMGAAESADRLHTAITAARFRGAIHRASARGIPSGVDLALIATPPDTAGADLEQCGRAGVRTAVLVDQGENVPELRQRLLATARRFGMRLVGPGSAGVANTAADIRLNATTAADLPSAGRVAIACEDGGLGLALLQQTARRNLGVSVFVSLGDSIDVSIDEFLHYVDSTYGTGAVLLYLERFDRLNRSVELLRRVGRSRPIVVVTAGTVAVGPAPHGSHTARLASRGAAFDALCAQSGVIRAGTTDEMLDVAACLDLQPLPRGPRVAIVSDAAASAAFAGAAVPDAGLTVTSVKTCAAADYAAFVEQSLTSDDADTVIVLCASAREYLADPFEAIRDGVSRARNRGSDKPVLICVPAVDALPCLKTRGGEAIPVFGFPENALRALGLAAAYARWRRESPGLFWGFDDVNAEDARETCRQVAEARGDTWLTGEEVRRVLNDFGLPLVPSPTARSEDEAAALAAIIGYPVVLKVASPSVLHKTEAGAVKVNLADESAVRRAYRELAARFPDARPAGADASIIVQPMVGNGVETLVGVAASAATGPLVGFGLGGRWAEALADVAFRRAPLTDADADHLIHGIRGAALLNGYRGAEPGDIDALREILLRVSAMCTSVPEIQEVDLNPTVVLPAGHGCRIVDARIRVRPV